jgi:hexosaminidase
MTHLFNLVYIGIMRILLVISALFAVAEKGESCFHHLSYGLISVSSRLVQVPTENFESTGSFLDLVNIDSIHVDPQYANSVDDHGETLIPPSLLAFGETFAQDLSTALGRNISAEKSETTGSSIYLTIHSDGNYTDAAGRWTSEGYTLNVTDIGITVSGASPLGAWWGTRTILQAAALNNGSVPIGTGIDAPGWGHRGIMMDVGRKYYPAPFLVEMCSYLSYFKQNVLHLHLSDNLVKVDPALYNDTVYSAFRLDLPDANLEGLNKRKNESYSREVFEDLQEKCAARGVTIVPEIEAPGHALVITQWKPEIALEGDQSYLDLDNPETLPAVQSIWDAALPWIHSKTVHLGADEYSSDHIDKYNEFVTKLSAHIQEVSGKSSRIWGTFPPKANYTNIPTDVTVQHWAAFADNALFDYIKNNYSVVNSDDGFYIVNKYSGSYPQVLNFDRVFHGNPADKSQFAPYIFDGANSTNNADPSEPRVIGHEAAIWNDFGPTATVVSETYAALRRGLPALGDKQWGGDITEDEYNAIFEMLHSSVPAQNLDLAIESQSPTILHYDFGSLDGERVKDQSGNDYHGKNHGCKIENSTMIFDGTCYLSTPLDIKGQNYTLAFQVQSDGNATSGSLFSNDVYALTTQNGIVTFMAEGTPYPLNYTLPEGLWTYLELSGEGGHTYLKVGNGTQYEFTTTFDVSGTGIETKEIAIPVPLSEIGKGFQGSMRDIVLSTA